MAAILLISTLLSTLICGLLIGALLAIGTRIGRTKRVRFTRGFLYGAGASLLAAFVGALFIPLGLIALAGSAIASMVFMIVMLVRYEELGDTAIAAVSVFTCLLATGLIFLAFAFVNAASVMGMGP